MPTLKLLIDATQAQQGASQFTSATDRVTDGARKARDEFGRFTKGSKDLREEVDRGSKSLDSSAVSIKGVVAALGGMAAASQAVRTMAGFDQIMRTIQGVTKASAQDMAIMESAARRTALTSSDSAQEVASSMLTLARAGFDTNAVLATTPAVLNLATAEMLGLDHAANLVIATLMQYGFAADQANRVTDVLIASSNAANTGAAELGEGLKFVGSFARAVKVDFETTAAALSVLSNNAISGSLSGVALRGMLGSLVKPTDQAVDALESMGLELSDVDVRSKGLVGVLRTLKDAGLDADRSLKIFGRETTPGALALVGSVEEIQKIVDINRQATGAARDLAEVVGGSLSAAYNRFKNTLSEMAISAGREGGVVSALIDLVNFSSEVVMALGGMSTGMGGVSAAAQVMADAIQTAAIVGGVFFAQYAIAKFNGLIGALFESARAFVTFGSTAGAASTFALGAIGAVAAGLWLLRDTTVEIGDEQVRVGDLVAAALTVTWRRIQAGFKIAWDFIVTGWNAIAETVGRVVDWIRPYVDDYWFYFKEGFKAVVNFALGLINGVWDQMALIGQRLKDMWSALADIDVTSIDSVKDGLDKLATAMDPATFVEDSAAAWRAAFQKDYMPVLEKAGEDAAKWFREGWKSIGLSGVLSDIGSEFGDYWEEVKRQAKFRASVRSTTTARNTMPSVPGVLPVAPPAPVLGQDPVPTDGAAAKQSLEAMQRLRDFGARIDKERELIGVFGEEREMREQLMQLDKLSAEAGLRASDARVTAIRRQVEQLRQLRQMREIANGMGQAFGDAFARMVTGANSAREAVEGLARAVMELIVQQTVARPLASAISTGLMGLFTAGAAASVGVQGPGMVPGSDASNPGFIPSALGNVFDSGRLIRHALGGVPNGIIDSTVIFPMRNGDIGMAGEGSGHPGGRREFAAKPVRMPDGSLGVQTAGGGNTYVTMNINTPNADSFRRTVRQTTGAVRNAMR